MAFGRQSRVLIVGIGRSFFSIPGIVYATLTFACLIPVVEYVFVAIKIADKARGESEVDMLRPALGILSPFSVAINVECPKVAVVIFNSQVTGLLT